MIDTKTIRARLSDPAKVCGLLGIKRSRTGQICCPMHDDRNPSASMGVRDGGLVWYCHVCGDGGDIFKLIQEARGVSFVEAGRIASDLCGVSEIEAAPEYTPEPEPEPVYPDEIARAVLLASEPLPKGFLSDRYPAPLDNLGTWEARILGDYRGFGSGFVRSWHRGGYDLILPLFDSSGEFRSLMARATKPREGMPKSLTAGGYSCKGLALLSPAFRDMIKGSRWPRKIMAVEGEIDFLFAMSQRPDMPIIGIRSGTLTRDWRDAIPDESTIYSCLDIDPAGDRYDEKLTALLSGKRCQIRRMRDHNA